MILWVASLAWLVTLWVRSPETGAAGMMLWWALPTLPLFLWERALRPRTADEAPSRHGVTAAVVLTGAALIALATVDADVHLRLDGVYLRRRWMELAGDLLGWAYLLFPAGVVAAMLLASTGALPPAVPPADSGSD